MNFRKEEIVMKKVFLLLVVVMFAASCKVAPGTLTLMQGKPEIDAALKAYSAEWAKARKSMPWQQGWT